MLSIVGGIESSAGGAGDKLVEGAGARDPEGSVDDPLDLLDELHGMRQLGMDFERRLVAPARMDVEEPLVARRAEDLEPRAAGLRGSTHAF